ncbi:MAG TPA: hypothetical protein VIY28_03385 [Pseudonocardiaceae bacterium]
MTHLVNLMPHAAEVARPDLVFPDLEIRDERHRVIGCQRLARFSITLNAYHGS